MGLSPVLQRFPEPVGVVAPVGDQPFGSGQAVQEGRRSGVVAYLAGSHEKPQRSAHHVCYGVQPRVQTALRAAD